MSVQCTHEYDSSTLHYRRRLAQGVRLEYEVYIPKEQATTAKQKNVINRMNAFESPGSEESIAIVSSVAAPTNKFSQEIRLTKASTVAVQVKLESDVFLGWRLSPSPNPDPGGDETLISSGAAASDVSTGVVIGTVSAVVAVVAVVGLGAAYVYFREKKRQKAKGHSRAPTFTKVHTDYPCDSSLAAVPTASTYGTETVFYSNPNAAFNVREEGNRWEGREVVL